MTKFRNFNQGRVKELIDNALREASGHLETNPKPMNPPYKFNEFDAIPEKHISDDSKGIIIKRYDTETGEPLALCSISQKYLNLIHDGELTDRVHEYNIFRKYASLFSLKRNGIITLCKTELACPEDCDCLSCSPPIPIDTSNRYTREDILEMVSRGILTLGIMQINNFISFHKINMF